MNPLSIFLLGFVCGAIALWLAYDFGLVSWTETHTETKTRTETKTTNDCYILTDQPGQRCPQCGTDVQPNVAHRCSKDE